MMKAQRYEVRVSCSSRRIEELEAQVAQLAKFEDLHRSNQKLEEDLNRHQGHFEEAEARTSEEIESLEEPTRGG